MTGGSYDRPIHLLRSLLRDLREAWKHKTLHLSCKMTSSCECGGEYHALRNFITLPKAMFQRCNPFWYLDTYLWLDHNRAICQVFHDEKEKDPKAAYKNHSLGYLEVWTFHMQPDKSYYGHLLKEKS